jgi:hypothetical protein
MKRTTTTMMAQPAPCPACGRPNDRNTGMGERAPADGDVAVCFGCQAILVFEGGALRRPTDGERREAEADPRVRDARRALQDGAGWYEAITRRPS